MRNTIRDKILEHLYSVHVSTFANINKIFSKNKQLNYDNDLMLLILSELTISFDQKESVYLKELQTE